METWSIRNQKQQRDEVVNGVASMHRTSPIPNRQPPQGLSKMTWSQSNSQVWNSNPRQERAGLFHPKEAQVAPAGERGVAPSAAGAPAG